MCIRLLIQDGIASSSVWSRWESSKCDWSKVNCSFLGGQRQLVESQLNQGKNRYYFTSA